MTDPIVLSYHDSIVRLSDVRLLEPPNWLNDRIIGFCFEYFEYELDKNSNFSFVTPDVAQFIKLCSSEELSPFLSPLELTVKDLVFLPVNDNCGTHAGGGHWSLLVYSKRSGKFSHYDSSKNFNRNSAEALMKKLATYLRCEPAFIDVDAPQQQNSHDCGLYVVCITEYLCRQAMGDSLGQLCDEVTADSVSRKRRELHVLIDKLSKGQTP